MVIDITMALEGAAGAVTAFGGLYAGFRHVVTGSKRKKEEYRQGIINQANEEMAKIKSGLEDKIKVLEVELASQRASVARDFSHLREVYNAEIKVLGEKIDNLRSDLQDQHSSMVNLLTKLVNSR